VFNEHLTRLEQMGNLDVQIEKGSAGIGVLSVQRCLQTRAICRGFYMVRRMGAPSGAPFTLGGYANLVRLATRNWRFCGWVLKPTNGGSIMTNHIVCLNFVEAVATASIDAETNAVELEGLALALRIVVTDYLSDRQVEKCNALDALTCALHDKAKANSLTAGKPEAAAHA
jgi:hypothetical protein